MNQTETDTFLLVAEGVTKKYRVGKLELPVLRGIDLTVKEGEVIVMAGPSGAGKSTLLHILGGLDTPTSGRVLLAGDDLSRLSNRTRARLRSEKVGFVFQFFHLLPEFKAWENVVIPCRIRGGGGENRLQKRLRERAAHLLEQVDLADRMNHYPSQLSGGEQQRVAIARALSNDPCLILADEPTGNLDSRAGDDLLNLFGRLHSETGKTLVLVSHDQQVADWAPRIIRIRDGLLENGGD
ncbi:MAG: ABC transporter ATP-binding protein [PVC group bacterium]